MKTKYFRRNSRTVFLQSRFCFFSAYPSSFNIYSHAHMRAHTRIYQCVCIHTHIQFSRSGHLIGSLSRWWLHCCYWSRNVCVCVIGLSKVQVCSLRHPFRLDRTVYYRFRGVHVFFLLNRVWWWLKFVCPQSLLCVLFLRCVVLGLNVVAFLHCLMFVSPRHISLIISMSLLLRFPRTICCSRHGLYINYRIYCVKRLYKEYIQKDAPKYDTYL